MPITVAYDAISSVSTHAADMEALAQPKEPRRVRLKAAYREAGSGEVDERVIL